MRIILAVLTAAACLGLSEPAHAQKMPPPDAAAPPGAQDVSVHIGAAQIGQSIQVSVGERFAIELVATPSAGLSWSLVGQPGFLSPPKILTGPLLSAQQRPGFVGGDRWQVFIFMVNGPGSGPIGLQLRDGSQFLINIEAR